MRGKSKLVSEGTWRKGQYLRPDLRYVVLAGSDHYIPEIKPAEVAELVSQLV